MLMDEPCTGLDVVVRRELLSAIRREAVTNGTTVIYITHHGDEVLWVADQLIVFDRSQEKDWKFEIVTMTLAEALTNPPTPEVRFHLTQLTNAVFSRVDGEEVKVRAFPPDAIMAASGPPIVNRMSVFGECCLVDLADGTRFVAREALVPTHLGSSIQLDTSFRELRPTV